MRLKSALPAALKYQAVVIEQAAREAGLDSFDVVFELLDAKDVNGVAAYGGFPVRYPSWRFGMEYERLEKGYRWGLSKIYELVINNDPTYAYLVRSNSLLEQKLVMAHVYGHADFFKNNLWFAPTDRKMLDTMGTHSTRIRRYLDVLGVDVVEAFLDRVLSLDTLIDPYLPLRSHAARPRQERRHTPLSERALRSLEAVSASPWTDGDDDLDADGEPPRQDLPTYDVLGFLEEHAPLEPWQRQLLRIVRREAYYFAPQRMTKIMNEGWASFWHSRLLTGGILEPSEIVDFADCHAGATASPPGQVNPYKLGIEIYRHAEQRGMDIFRLRRVHNDVSLVHEVVDEELALRHVAPIYVPRQRLREAEEALDWRAVVGRLLQDLSWGGLPQIEVVDVDAEGDGELLLVHHHDGRDLQLGRASETLKSLQALWRRPVHLLTIEDKQGRRIVCSGGEVSVLDTREAERACSSEAG